MWWELDITIEHSSLDGNPTDDKPAADIDPGNLYSAIDDETLLTLNDLAKVNYSTE